MQLRADTYLYDTEAASIESGLECKDPTLAQQSFAEEVDINTIVKRFGLTGELPHNLEVPMREDFVEVFDFQSAMNVVRKAEESFMELPADVRARFANDPGRFLEFVGDPDNTDEAVKLGIAVKRVVVEEPAASSSPAPAPGSGG